MNIDIDKLIETMSLFAEGSATIEPNTQVLESGVIDSLNVFQIIAEVERAFGHKISPIDLTMDDFQTPVDLKAALERIWHD